jgi:hypothetical protein
MIAMLGAAQSGDEQTMQGIVEAGYRHLGDDLFDELVSMGGKDLPADAEAYIEQVREEQMARFGLQIVRFVEPGKATPTLELGFKGNLS